MSTDFISIKDSKSSCCGCGACAAVCPAGAVTMEPDEYGALYPRLDPSACVKCGKCTDICSFGATVTVYPLAGYAAASRSEQVLSRSSSGGVFAELAAGFLRRGGCVAGAVMLFGDNGPRVEHRIVESESQMEQLQGSKYVQSDIGGVLLPIKKLLRDDRPVLFSGTPCQTAAVRKFCGDASGLYTMDLVCHGVPGAVLFGDYVRLLERKHKGHILSLTFRDKRYGAGKTGSFRLLRNGQTVDLPLPCPDSSYYSLFMDNELQRESCFSCPYASEERASDITAGDFWGIEKSCPSLLLSGGGSFDQSRGISCVLVNTEKGRELLDSVKDRLQTAQVHISDISAHNSQLRHPALMGKRKELTDRLYRIGGFPLVDSLFSLRKRLRRLRSRSG